MIVQSLLEVLLASAIAVPLAATRHPQDTQPADQQGNQRDRPAGHFLLVEHRLQRIEVVHDLVA